MEWAGGSNFLGLFLLVVAILPPYLHYRRSKTASSLFTHPPPSNFRPEVTILLPMRDESKHAIRKLDEVLSMNYPEKAISILVIESCSSDGTASIAREYLDSSKSSISWEIVSLSVPGKSVAVNHALKKIDTDFFVMMDSDSFCTKESLCQLMDWFADEKIGAVCGRYNIKKNEPDYDYRSRFNTIRTGESSIDSTPIFEGSICAFRTASLREQVIDNSINADDSQLSMIIRSNGFRTIMDPRISFTEESSLVSRRRKVRRSQGLIRTLWKNRGLCKGNGEFSNFILHSIYFHIFMPWMVLISLIFLCSSTISSISSGQNIGIVTIMSCFIVIVFLFTRLGRGLISGILILIDSQLRLVMGQTLEKWIPERS